MKKRQNCLLHIITTNGLMKCILFIIFLIFILFPLQGNSDIIILKNGERIETESVWEEGNQIKCFRFGGIVGYLMSEVDRVEKSTKPQKSYMNENIEIDIKSKRNSSTSSMSKTNRYEESLEYKLAVINAGRYVSQDHITVARFRSLLQQLSNTFIENKPQISDMTVKAQELLRKEGIEEKF